MHLPDLFKASNMESLKKYKQDTFEIKNTENAIGPLR